MSENYINNCRSRGEIRLKTLMAMCKEKGIDYNYVFTGIASNKLIHLKDDEMVVKKSDWDILNANLKMAKELLSGNKTAEHRERTGDREKSGVVAGNKRAAKSHDPP
jgi:hypothetical protein